MTKTANKSLDLPAYNATGWDVPTNRSMSVLDTAIAGVQPINLAAYSGGTIVLTDTFPIVTSPLTSMSYIPAILEVFGALIQDVVIAIPAGISGQWTCNNLTSGAFTVSVGSLGGGYTINIPQGASVSLASDGSSVFVTTSIGIGNGLTASSGVIALQTPVTVANGGTGKTSLTSGALLLGNGTGAVSTLAPAAAGSILGSNGSTWGPMTIAGAGTVTSVGLNPGTTGLTVGTNSTNPITGAGTFTLGGTLGIANGGTGLATFGNGYIKGNGVNPLSTVSTIPASDISGLGNMSQQSASSVNITGGSATLSTLTCPSHTFASGVAIAYTGGTLSCNFSAATSIYGSSSNVVLSVSGNGVTGWQQNSFNVGAGVTAYYSSSTWTVSSDARLKKDVEDYALGLEAVLSLRPRTFKYNGRGGTADDGITRVGLIAQEAQETALAAMVREHEGYLTLDNSELVYALVNAVKELAAQVRALSGS